MEYQYNDGGRADAGFKGETGDCVVRAIAIAAGLEYKDVYRAITKISGESPRSGVHRRYVNRFLESVGFVWKPTMGIGTGCTVHLCAGELPRGRLVVRVSKHVVAVVDGVVHDNHDSRRDGTRCVYGYWFEKENSHE